MTELELAIRAVIQEIDRMHPDDRKRIAVAVLAGQPFGLTHEDVDLLRESEVHRADCFVLNGGRLDAQCDCDHDERQQRARALAERIEALLPPKHFPPTP